MDKHAYFENRAKSFDMRTHLDLLLDYLMEDPIAKNLTLRWRKIILSILKEDDNNSLFNGYEEVYSLVVGYNTGSFEYVFNIDRANSIISELRKEPIEMPVLKAIKFVDIENLHKNQKTKINNHENPILIIKSNLFDQPHCINGNHRILDAFQKGKNTVSLYWIEDRECIPFLFTRLSRAMYMMNADIVYVMNQRENFDPKNLLIEQASSLLS